MKKKFLLISIFSLILLFLIYTSGKSEIQKTSRSFRSFLPAEMLACCQSPLSNCYKKISNLSEFPENTNFNIYETPNEYKTKKIKNCENVLIILDCSFSMDDQIRGKRKIDMARDVINDVLGKLPPNINLGFRVYGQDDGGILGLDGCTATELLVPIACRTQNAISAKLKNLDAIGWTPISYSLEQAINNDFTQVAEKKRIILVSDGVDTCGGDPCEFAVDLMKKRSDIIIDVIGFNISSEPEAISQLKCVALATHGKFYTANNADEFTKSLRKSLNVKKEVEGKIFTH